VVGTTTEIGTKTKLEVATETEALAGTDTAVEVANDGTLV
jgi:hypothetical protein